MSFSATPPSKSAVSSSSQLLISPDRASVLQAVQRSQTTMTEQATKEQWRLAFNREAFGIDPTVKDGPTPKTGRTSKTLTRKEWEERVHILRSWGDPENCAELPPSVVAFRRSHTKGYHLALNFFLVPYGPPEKTSFKLHAYGDSKSSNEWEQANRIVVHAEEVFDILYKQHHEYAHMKGERMHTALKHRYYNISQAQCYTFVKLCPTCDLKLPKRGKAKGAKNPILSFAFRDRMSADLIDYRNDPAPMDPEDNECNVHYVWLLVIKDHFTRFTYLRPLPSKTARGVAREIKFYFSLVGYPIVFQSDNGNEFKAEVLSALKSLNPYMYTLNGRPRTPSDGGSVERTNRPIKDGLAASVHYKRSVLPPEQHASINWSTEIPNVMRSINSACGQGRGNVAPYKAVYLTEFDDPLFAQFVDHAGNPTDIHSVEERIHHLQHNVVNKLQRMGEISGFSDQLSLPPTGTVPLKQAGLPGDDEFSTTRKRQKFGGSAGDPYTAGQEPLKRKLFHAKSSTQLLASSSSSSDDDPILKPVFSTTKKSSPTKATYQKFPITNSFIPSSDDEASLPKPVFSSAKKSISSLQKEIHKNAILSQEGMAATNQRSKWTFNPYTGKPLKPFSQSTSRGLLQDGFSSGGKRPVTSTSTSSLTKTPPQANTTVASLVLPGTLDYASSDDDDITHPKMKIPSTPSTSSSNNDMDKKLPHTPSTSSSNDMDKKLPAVQKQPVAVKKEGLKYNWRAIPQNPHEYLASHSGVGNSLNSLLICVTCCPAPKHCTTIVLYTEGYMQHFYHPNTWLETKLIVGFISMLIHLQHPPNILFYRNTYPRELESSVGAIEPGFLQGKTIIMLAYASSHYALLQIDVHSQRILVTDGLRRQMRYWQDHIMSCLVYYGLVPEGTRAKQVLDIRGDSSPFVYSNQPHKQWKLKHTVEVQYDSSSCGVIACAKAWQVITGKTLLPDLAEHRKEVLDKYVTMSKELPLRFQQCFDMVDVDGPQDIGREMVVVDVEDDVDGDEDKEDKEKEKDKDEDNDEDDEDEDDDDSGDGGKDQGKKDKDQGNKDRDNNDDSGWSGGTAEQDPGNKSHKKYDNNQRRDDDKKDKQHTQGNSVQTHSRRQAMFKDAEYRHSKKHKTYHSGGPGSSSPAIHRNLYQKFFGSDQQKYGSAMAKRLATKQKLESMGRYRQDQQAMGMIKLRNKTKAKCSVGDVVMLDVPKNQRSRTCPLDLRAIVCKVNQSGTAMLATEYGLLSSGNGILCYNPEVLKLRAGTCIEMLPSRLQEVMVKIKDGSYDIANVARVSVAEAHAKSVHNTGSLGAHRCGCKKTRKGFCTSHRCKCRSKGTLCGSGCGCGGKCGHTMELADKFKQSAIARQHNYQTLLNSGSLAAQPKTIITP